MVKSYSGRWRSDKLFTMVFLSARKHHGEDFLWTLASRENLHHGAFVKIFSGRTSLAMLATEVRPEKAFNYYGNAFFATMWWKWTFMNCMLDLPCILLRNTICAVSRRE